MGYQHLFFDLDHTLWDHQRNADETLSELFQEYNIAGMGDFTERDFIEKFHQVNHLLWDDYNMGRIDQSRIRKQRFPLVLQALGVNGNPINGELSRQYLVRCPTKPYLMPHALETLDYLHKRYDMTIITNGFFEVQATKMACSGLDCYFPRVVTSEEAGELKPHPRIFSYALDNVKQTCEACVMIGDNPSTDIAGARLAGIDQIYYDPQDLKQTPSTFRVMSLLELTDLL